MKLNKLLEGVAGEGSELEVLNVVVDSRKVVLGSLFIAYQGVSSDGYDFIDQAIENGAVAVVGERDLELSVPYFKVVSGRLAWARIVSNWYGNPEKRLRIVGVTGTDGKTTTVNLIYHILKTAGKKVSMTSTIRAMVGDTEVDTGLHTSSLDPDKLWPMLEEMVKSGSRYAVLEATSHGLAQDRFGEIEFEVGVLTNLAHDHLEFHGTIEEYASAKAKLFSRSKISILNAKANNLEIFKEAAAGSVVLYDREEEVRNIKYKNLDGEMRQSFEIKIKDKFVRTSCGLLGDYNLESILAATKVAIELGIGVASIKKGIQSFPMLKGRFEIVPTRKGITIVIDFAHTQQGMQNVLSLVRDRLRKEGQKIVVVFGCNGERDRSKRAPMGKTACSLADLVVVTTEDPRNENVNQIFEDIKVGCEESGGVLGETFFRMDDRRGAIAFAINELAKPGDFVLCLGKGHEESMNMGGVEKPWDERRVVEEVLNRL